MNWIVSPATYWNMNPVKINKQLLSINCVKRKVNINQMKNSLLILPLLSGLFAQGYNLEDCIKIALDGKKTLLSAELNVTSAERGVTGSYSGLLPSLNATTGVGRTQFPERESISLTMTISVWIQPFQAIMIICPLASLLTKRSLTGDDPGTRLNRQKPISILPN